VPETGNKFLDRMLDRLYAALSGGPSLNCRPHASRQRIDLTVLARLADEPAETLIARLLAERKPVRISVKPPKGVALAGQADDEEGDDGEDTETPPADAEKADKAEPATEPAKPTRSRKGSKGRGREEARAAESKAEAEAVAAALRKLGVIAEDSRSYRQDTGVHALFLGWPVLHLPPTGLPSGGGPGGGRFGGSGGGKRVLAPLAFVPVEMTVAKGRVFTVELSAIGEGAELVVPNSALLAWIERQTGRPCGEMFADEEGQDPYREINSIVSVVSEALGLATPAEIKPDSPVTATPRTDDPADAEARIVPAAVLGLFPHANQSLIRDTQAIADGERVEGPAQAFIRVDGGVAAAVDGKPAEAKKPAETKETGGRRFAEERHVAVVDPCQAKAVRAARRADILVVHGPPGTGKSQTIADMVGDHLARGQRVLMVCDKRGALDVVLHRLDRIGLGGFCAVVHDAQADQRPLYLSLREQLDALPEARTDAAAETKLAAADRELQGLHDQLAAHTAALTDRPGPEAMSFHELVGTWLALGGARGTQAAAAAGGPELNERAAGELSPAEVERRERDIREALTRGLDVGHADNPWTKAAGVGLSAFLARPVEGWRSALSGVSDAAAAADASADPAIPPLPEDGDGAAVAAVAAARTALAEPLERMLRTVSQARLTFWAGKDDAAVRRAAEGLAGLAEPLATFRAAAAAPDAELAAVHRGDPLTAARIAPWLLALDEYLETASRWYAWFLFGRKRAAAEVLRVFGLALNVANAQRVRRFLAAAKARLTLAEFHDSHLSASPLPDRSDGPTLAEALTESETVISLLRRVATEPALSPLAASVRAAMADPSLREGLLRGLRLSAARGVRLAALESALSSTGLFGESWLAATRADLRRGGAAALFAPTAAALTARLPQLEGVLRIRDGLAALPGPISAAVGELLSASASPDDGWRALRRAAIHSEIRARLAARPELHRLDGEAIEQSFRRIRALEEKKRGLVRDAIVHTWTQRQRDRLLAGTGSRLNSQGAELRRRLLLRGERALRLRQVVAVGQDIEGGDPLFDLRPVWMTGPGTAAQIFPRRAMFDVVIFDEASQCRLEEALPVLARGRRAVIAGDPNQLPPTRFFESAVAKSEDDEPETDQDLFESQQAEVDDLLAAALNLSVEQCYLDVHYRSRNADLIEFSNRSFYESRLQPIPGHPSSRAVVAPLRVHRVDGVYEKRGNPKEAEYVVKIVRELLRRAEPPSIGVACFNLVQRDLITDALDEAAAEDREFAKRLAEARTRQGAGSFEGLFVKNLENVQGDERDVMIISTTYGPDAAGKFRRRFGPLARPGGGKRLNVLVTRARAEVHLVTSIPAEAYRSLPPVPDGATPGGGWLLFSYLKFAEDLDHLYQEGNRRRADAERDGRAAVGAGEAAPPPAPGVVDALPSEVPSPFARALAERLADGHGLSSTVHWGNDGFCVDLALRHPERPGDVTVGVLCDGTRYPKAADAVEWDLFRTGVLEGQGWTLHRLWTPHFFRDPHAAMERVSSLAKPPRKKG
jgi:hypothetical protein